MTSLGTTVSFHCKTPLAVRRYMQWVRLHEDRIEELVDQTEVLTIYNVTEEDAGHYACTIGTTPQNIIFESAFLTVVDPPDPGIVRHTTPAHTKLIVIVVCVSALAMFLVVVIFFTIYQPSLHSCTLEPPVYST